MPVCLSVCLSVCLAGENAAEMTYLCAEWNAKSQLNQANNQSFNQSINLSIYLSTPCLKNVPPLACCNFDTREWILIVFGKNVTDIIGNQKDTLLCHLK